MIDQELMLSETLKDIKPSGIRKFFDLLADMGDVTALTVGQPDFVTPWHIREAAIQSLERGHTYYTSNSGLPELRSEIAKYMNRRFGLEYSPGEILVTVGGSEAIDVAVRALVNPGDEVIIPMPSFVCYEPIARMAGAVPVIINTKAENGFKLTADELRQAITPKTKMLILPYPNNPTGAILEREELTRDRFVFVKYALNPCIIHACRHDYGALDTIAHGQALGMGIVIFIHSCFSFLPK